MKQSVLYMARIIFEITVARITNNFFFHFVDFFSTIDEVAYVISQYNMSNKRSKTIWYDEL